MSISIHLGFELEFLTSHRCPIQTAPFRIGHLWNAADLRSCHKTHFEELWEDKGEEHVNILQISELTLLAMEIPP